MRPFGSAGSARSGCWLASAGSCVVAMSSAPFGGRAWALLVVAWVFFVAAAAGSRLRRLTGGGLGGGAARRGGVGCGGGSGGGGVWAGGGVFLGHPRVKRWGRVWDPPQNLLGGGGGFSFP